MGFAACALIMTSCTKQEVIENVFDGHDQLSFSTGLGKQSTKAPELMNNTLQADAVTDGITIHAYQNTEGSWEKWFNDEVVFNPSWKLKNSTRFRNVNATKYITYFSKVTGALTATDADFINADFTPDKFPKFSYTVAANSATQEDLIAGITEVDVNQTDITLGLRHILSQVNFGTIGYKGANIAIQNIQIKGLFNSATYTYGEADSYPIGNWDAYGTDNALTTRNATYSYFNHTNATTATNSQPNVPASATSSDIYIFGDGGNWGPGKETLYPVGPLNAWEKYNTTTPQTSLKNSLMLIPQDFTGVEDAKVTFEYKITDVDSAFVAGDKDTWEKSEFKLDFSTGTDPDIHYNAKWQQNYRYVYLIDFTDFLDGIALTFKVNVEMYPWENHNNETDDNGGVNIMAAGQPSATNMNTITNGKTWYIASQSETSPATVDPKKWAQVMRNETWNLKAYDFRKIEKGQKITLNFLNVIFNTTGTNPDDTEIDLTLPIGYTAEAGAGITVDENTAPRYTVKKGNKTTTATIIITNTNDEYSTSTTLGQAITAVTTNAKELIYKGTEAINLKTMVPNLTTANETITVKFNSTVVPTVGEDTTSSGTWAWDVVSKTATWTKK